jgi:hypothetical protein
LLLSFITVEDFDVTPFAWKIQSGSLFIASENPLKMANALNLVHHIVYASIEGWDTSVVDFNEIPIHHLLHLIGLNSKRKL